MEDLAWFGVAGRIEGRRLVGCKMEKHAARNRGIEPEGLEGGDQRVAAKHGAEPRDSGVRERPLRRIRDQRVEVRDRTAKGFVEDGIGGNHRSGREDDVRSARRASRSARKVDRCSASPAPAPSQLISSRRVFWRLGSRSNTKVARFELNRSGARFEAQRRGAAPIIKPAISERNAVGADVGRLHRPASKAPRAAHLKEVREIRSESEIYP